MKYTFKAHTGLMGSTEPGQRVTLKKAAKLPPGSVIDQTDGSKLIHLHDGLWLWVSDHCAHCYGTLENHDYRLRKDSTVGHLPYSV